MKSTYIFIIVFLAGLQACAQKKENFDLVSYTPPAGWNKTGKAETVTFTKESGSDFSMITIYKGIDASDNAQSNFDMAWQSLVQENLGVAAKATMQPGSTDNGWETKIGSAPFDKDGIKGAAILISSSQNSKLVNILAITNTDAWQKEMEAFLASVDLKTAMVTKNNSKATATEQPVNKSKNKPELWAQRRHIQKVSNAPELGLKLVVDYYVIYPNGDYLANVPYEGLINLDKSYAAESWGKFTMQGTKGRFKNKYDDIAVIKKSAILMEKTGNNPYSYDFHKCLDVDGLRIEGAYTHVAPNWGKDPQLNYLNEPGCQFVIYFKKDGTFDDKGVFSSRGGSCTDCNCQGGKGTYSIENFTITFKYNDGRVVYRLFSTPPTRNPATYDETIYVGTTPYYKKL